MTKKINIANYELENHRSDIMRLKSQVQQLTETSQATTEQFTALDLKVDQCDKTVSKISSDTLSKKQYKLTHSILDSEVKGHFDMICQIKR